MEGRFTIVKREFMRKKQAKRLRQAAKFLSQVSGESPFKHYKKLKEIHKKLTIKEKQNERR